MKLATPRPATWFAESRAHAEAFVLHLAFQEIGAVIGEGRFPRVTVPSLSQEALNERVDAWRRGCAAAELARKEKEPSNA